MKKLYIREQPKKTFRLFYKRFEIIIFNFDGNFKLFVAGLAQIYDGLISVLTFGVINPELRCKIIFSKWYDND